ncbi:probable non-specific lipid-transfer protein 1 [Miscanthus floridulus]|uniref:probable non-specific lipid-transfer protein 1 n=1 Tax=Miscanthus floridulus TaxID=154761 RepID=UPI00345AB70D
MAPPRSKPAIIIACVLLSFLAAAAFAPPAAAAAPDEATCAPSLQRLLSCLDFIEHRSDEIPTPCCIQVKRTVAEQPCCLMHVVRGNAARLIGPEYDNTRAVVNVTAKCLGDASVLMSITRNCSGKPLPPLTPEFTFTTAAVPPPSSSSGEQQIDL